MSNGISFSFRAWIKIVGLWAICRPFATKYLKIYSWFWTLRDTSA
jgi:hypothetical protein